MNDPAEIWIDAAEFTERGGWKLDTQFAHLMGSMSAEKIRVTVTATNGDRSAKITEIRAGLEG